MRLLIASLGPILLISACGSRSSPPTAPTAVTPPQSNVSGATGLIPIPGTTVSPGGAWACPHGEGDLCIEDGSVSANDPTCFRDWDASGRCKQYDLVAPADGTLVATMRWAGPSRGPFDPDVFLVAPNGEWTYALDGWPEKHVSLSIKVGDVYRIVVLSYGPLQSFALTLKVLVS